MTDTVTLFDLELVAGKLAELIDRRRLDHQASEAMWHAWHRCAHTDTPEPTVPEARALITDAWRAAMGAEPLPADAARLLEL